MDKTSIGDRMKRYEKVTKDYLVRRMPVIIRLDGKAFHTWTKQLNELNDESLSDSPFSDIMHYAMAHTGMALVKNIQNARIAYIQSDEISILLNDWGKLETHQWFEGNIQKIVSVSASVATAYFNLAMAPNYTMKPAMFDSRVFNIPKEDVANYFIWRQQDATRNSVNMLGQFYFSHKEMQNKNVKQVMDMLHEIGKDWNHIDTWMKRGYCAYRGEVDDEIPIFTKDRYYIEQHLQTDED
jgi:tRNA(His) 5'-end guanylyltransferase